jgi:hypothetical protein
MPKFCSCEGCYVQLVSKGDYCSSACRQKAYRPRHTSPRPKDDDRNCEFCFGPLPAGSRPNRRTCSARCRVALNRDLRQMAQDGNLRAFEALARYILPLPAQRLRISEEPTEEYRVAGYTPAEINTKMLERLATKIEERRVYEDQLAQAGVAGYERSNGNAVSRKKPSTASKSSGRSARAASRTR